MSNRGIDAHDRDQGGDGKRTECASRPAAPAKGETTPAALEIKPSPVIEPDPGFFVGAGDGGNGYYAERPAR